MWFFTKNEGNI